MVEFDIFLDFQVFIIRVRLLDFFSCSWKSLHVTGMLRNLAWRCARRFTYQERTVWLYLKYMDTFHKSNSYQPAGAIIARDFFLHFKRWFALP